MLIYVRPYNRNAFRNFRRHCNAEIVEKRMENRIFFLKNELFLSLKKKQEIYKKAEFSLKSYMLVPNIREDVDMDQIR